MSTVLEQDHFYSDFLVSYLTVTTNSQKRDDEATRLLHGKAHPRTWCVAVLMTIVLLATASLSVLQSSAVLLACVFCAMIAFLRPADASHRT